MKLRKGDVVLYDPNNTLKATRLGSTIHGVVIETGFRKATIISMETYDRITCPKSILVKMPIGHNIKVVERSEVFKPRFTDKELTTMSDLLSDLQNGEPDFDIRASVLSSIINKMQADRIDYNIKIGENLKVRLGNTPNVTYGLVDLIDSKTLDEWKDVSNQLQSIAQLIEAVRPAVTMDVLYNMADIGSNCEDLKIIKAVDNYFDGHEIDEDSIIDCVLELTHSESVSEITSDYADVVALGVVHAVSIADDDDQVMLLESIKERLNDDGLSSEIMAFFDDMISSFYDSGDFDE